MHRLSQIHIAPFQKQTMLGAGSKSSSELIEDGVPSNPFFPERATLAHSPPPNLMMDCGPEDVPPPTRYCRTYLAEDPPLRHLARRPSTQDRFLSHQPLSCSGWKRNV